MKILYAFLSVVVLVVVIFTFGIETAAEPAGPYNPPTTFNQVVLQVKDSSFQEKLLNTAIEAGPPAVGTIFLASGGRMALDRFLLNRTGAVKSLTAEGAIGAFRNAESAEMILKRYGIASQMSSETTAAFRGILAKDGYLVAARYLLKNVTTDPEIPARMLVAAGHVDDATLFLRESKFVDARGKKYTWNEERIGKWLFKEIEATQAEFRILARALRGEKVGEEEMKVLTRWGVKVEDVSFYSDYDQYQIVLTPEKFEALSGLIMDGQNAAALLLKRPANYKGGGTLVIPLMEVQGVGKITAAGSKLWTGEGMPTMTQVGDTWHIRVPANGVSTEASALSGLGNPMRVRAGGAFVAAPGARNYTRLANDQMAWPPMSEVTAGKGSVAPMKIDVRELDAFAASDWRKRITQAKERGLDVKVDFANADGASPFQAHFMSDILDALGNR